MLNKFKLSTMLKSKLWILSILFAFLLITSCKKDDETPTVQINESEVLATFLESTDCPLMKDYVNSDMPSIISATDVYTLNQTGQIYIIDIRSATDFATGHIENAHNVALGDLLTHIESVDLTPYTKVAIVCVTGQTAGYAALLLRLLGYDKVFSMKWGMCSWNDVFATAWQNNIGNTYATQFTTDVTAKGPKGNMPKLTTGKTNGMAILEARVDDVFAEGFDVAKITAQTVFNDLTNYYILNYWPQNHYDIGHIPGAIQYTPKQSIALAADLKTLPTDKTIVVYCYTGQNSAFLTGYLRLLGYDAKSILFGTNGMIYDIMVTEGMTVFKADQIMGYPYI